MTIIIVGTVILAFIHDPSGTAKLVATTSSISGVTWICKKVTEQINRDASQIIYFTGCSMAGVSAVKIIGNAMGSITKVTNFFGNVSATFVRLGELLDKITFWN